MIGIKELLNRLVFFIYESNLRLLGRYNDFEKSKKIHYQRYSYTFRSRLQAISILSFDFFVFGKTVFSFWYSHTSCDIIIVGAIITAFLFAHFFMAPDNEFESVFAEKEKVLSQSTRLSHHLITIVVFFLLPILVIALF